MIYSLSFLSPFLCFLTLLGCQVVRELIRGDEGHKAGRVGVGVSPWSDLPLNRIRYIPFSIFAYSSNIFIASLDLMDSMLTLGTLKYSRFSLSSSSCRDRAPAMNFPELICSTIHPGVALSYLSLIGKIDTVLLIRVWPLLRNTYWLVTSDIRLNSIKQITPALVFMDLLNAMPSGLFCSKVDPVRSVHVEPLSFFAFLPRGSRTSHLSFSCRVSNRLFRGVIKDLWEFLSQQFFPHCTKAFFAINTDKVPLRGG